MLRKTRATGIVGYSFGHLHLIPWLNQATIDLKHKLQVAHKQAKEELIGQKETRKELYDKKFGTKEANCDTGDFVYLKMILGRGWIQFLGVPIRY